MKYPFRQPFSEFILIVLAVLKSTTRIPGGLRGKPISKFYDAYFRAMDVSLQEIAYLENSSMLQDPAFGLSTHFAMVMNQPDWAHNLLCGKWVQILVHWKYENQLGGNTITVEPQYLSAIENQSCASRQQLSIRKD